MAQFQFKIDDPAIDVAGMAFSSEEARNATLDYIMAEHGVTLVDLAQIVFTRVEDGKMTIELALQRGEDVTSRARIVEEESA